MGKQILVVRKRKLDPIEYEGSFSDFCKDLDRYAEYMDRDLAETDENFCQIIPYTLVRRKEHFDDWFFLYQRLKGGTEARLHNKFSMGIGGHIDKPEKDLVGPLSNILFADAKRELVEELSLNIDTDRVLCPDVYDNTPCRFLIYDPSNAVGRVHLGVLMVYDIPSEAGDPKPKEIEKIEGSMASSLSIRDRISKGTLQVENWTKLALEML